MTRRASEGEKRAFRAFPPGNHVRHTRCEEEPTSFSLRLNLEAAAEVEIASGPCPGRARSGAHSCSRWSPAGCFLPLRGDRLALPRAVDISSARGGVATMDPRDERERVIPMKRPDGRSQLLFAMQLLGVVAADERMPVDPTGGYKAGEARQRRLLLLVRGRGRLREILQRRR